MLHRDYFLEDLGINYKINEPVSQKSQNKKNKSGKIEILSSKDFK
jgi:hypothetical protein